MRFDQLAMTKFGYAEEGDGVPIKLSPHANF